ncbi:hypothetical protein ACLGIH_20410 [Streptomyces sp. HMX87]|uniref:hypothetical protein n=1 Tax=Streptomyces sp. HMX87 TaxID=3390849 RepID=UPI003A835F74
MNARRMKALRRKQETARMRHQVETARAFVKQWRWVLVELPNGYDCHLNCGEAEAAYALWQVFGDPEAAESLIEQHTEKDECGDSHHECTEACQ